jgi:hypothetical protein
MPATPEAAQAFRDAAATQAIVANKATQSQAPQDIQSSGILSSIDQKLKAQGVEPAQFEKPPTAEELIAAAAAQKPQIKNVELEPKLALEKGPLYLSPAEVQSREKPTGSQEMKEPEGAESSKEPPNRILVKGPVQPQPVTAAAKSAGAKKPGSNQEDEPKGAFDQMRQDLEKASKVLNPFSW